MKGILKSEGSIRGNEDKPKYCVYCGNLVSQEAFFDAGNGVIVVEKYCSTCNGRVNLRLGAPNYHYGMTNLLNKKSSSKISLKG